MNPFGNSEWVAFVGRLHPLVVHVPIGFIAAVLLLEVISWFRPKVVGARTLLAWMAALAAGVAAFCGWLLSEAGGFDPDVLERHRWAGFGLVGLTFFLAVVQSKPGWRIPTSLLALTLVFVTGHYGGTMSRGHNYLAEHAPRWLEPVLAAARVDSAPAATVIESGASEELGAHAILQRSCYECHADGKQKGGLRLDTAEGIASVVVHGDVLRSELFRRVILPPSHDDAMPANGESLSGDEILVLRDWIAEGAEPPVVVSEPVATVEPPAEPTTAQLVIEPDVLAELRERSDLFFVLEGEEPRIDASRTNGKLEPSALADLSLFSGRIVELSLAGREGVGAALRSAPALPELRRLRLERSDITDENLYPFIMGLPALEELNLHSTAIRGDCFEVLGPELRKLYLADTQVPSEVIEALRAARPELEIIGAAELPETPALDPPILPDEGGEGE